MSKQSATTGRPAHHLVARVLAALGMVLAVLAVSASPASSQATVTVTPNPVPFTTNQTEAIVRVAWTGQKARQLMFINVCRKTVADPTFTPALDCSALSELNPNGTVDGNGSIDLTVFRGENPDGDSGWGCFAKDDQAPAGVQKNTTCFVRVTNGNLFNKDDAKEAAFTLSVGGDVVPEVPYGVIIPIIGAVVVAGAFFVLRRRAAAPA